MRAVVLAGGRGTRLRPYTVVLPKPLMPVGDRPVLDIVVRQLHRAGCERLTIATGYLAELIEAFFGDGHSYNVAIDYFRETHPLGTAGSLALIDDFDEPFLVMNGDVLTDIDYRQMLADHANSDAIATIASRQHEVEVSLGVLHFGDARDPSRLVTRRDRARPTGLMPRTAGAAAAAQRPRPRAAGVRSRSPARGSSPAAVVPRSGAPSRRPRP